MTTVTRSVGTSVSALFGTVTTAASVITTGFDSLGNFAEELNLRSAQRLKTVTLELKLQAEDTRSNVMDDHAWAQAERFAKRQADLQRDPELAKIYSACLTKYEAILATP